MKRKRRLLLAAVFFASGACTGSDVGNGITDIDFDVHGEIPDESSALLRGGGGSTTVSDVWVSIDRIRLRDAATCDGDTEIDLRGPFAVNARLPGTPPELSDIEVTATSYCRFELKWSAFDGDASNVPSELVGASFLIKGNRGDGTPFVLRSERGDDLRLDARDSAGFTIDEATSGLFVGADLADLFRGIALAAADVSVDDVIRIDRDNNRALLDAFEDNVDDFTALFADRDGDGELDPDERDETDALTQ